MRSTLLVLAFVLMAGATPARADFVSYNFTGTIKSTFASTGEPLPYSPGDHITWTLLYDRSTPVQNTEVYNYGSYYSYSMKSNVITNIVDQSNGYHVVLPSGGGGLLLFGDSKQNPSSLSASAGYSPPDPHFENSYSASMYLNYKESFPTMNLANLNFNSIPINFSTSDFNFIISAEDEQFVNTFDASVDSISGPFYGAPEPGSLTLFLLGAAGLAVGGVRRRLGILHT
ncbi:MAG TPA: PEP-CTERM sorting domain-containing protein [Gemmataceae bacterium]|nr:PEP-CTERM sorting domain-containing protein [Gemmataceae bacterium]